MEATATSMSQARYALNTFGQTCVIGLCWGDEGKGKIVDLLTEAADVVVRYNGGANAGHTIVSGGETFALHLVPCGALHEGKTGLLGPGVALDPPVLLEEIDALAARGIDVFDRLRLSLRCHIAMPYHKLEDRLSEAALTGSEKIGTTARGIGPCYADKMQRSSAVRFCDMLRTDDFARRVRRIVERKQKIFQALFGYDERIDADAIIDEYTACAERLRPSATDTTVFLRDRIAQGQRLLFEGAHGALLDIDHGTYPFVTSSSASAAGVSSGAGVPPRTVDTVIGVVKAYTTRVGQGPFPSEQDNDIGDHIRTRGREFGTTTGRPRRCGWFDAVAVRYAVELGGISRLAVMHLDTLSDLPEIRVCTAYRVGDTNLNGFPADTEAFEGIDCVYETFPGWQENIENTRSFDQLPPAARNYVERLEQLIGAHVSIVSVGPDRSQTIFRIA